MSARGQSTSPARARQSPARQSPGSPVVREVSAVFTQGGRDAENGSSGRRRRSLASPGRSSPRASPSARQVAPGRCSGKGAGRGAQLALRELATFLDLDPALAAVAAIIGPYLIGEVLDDFAVSDQQEFVV